jgi:cytochrome c peroxidase
MRLSLRHYQVILLMGAGIFLFVGCGRDESTELQLPSEGDGLTEADVELRLPAGFPSPVYNNSSNPITLDGFRLGRKLFYDPILSRDSTISCSSCHQQFAAFSHLDHDRSHGIDGLFGIRNAPGLMNLIWKDELMWDGGVNNLEVQPPAAITNPVEMDDDLANIVVKLKRHPEYPAMFRKAFGTDSVTSQRMLKAMAQFMSLMISADSKYDRVRAGREAFSTTEQEGYALFQAKCASCHAEPLLTDNSYRNNGLMPSPVFNDSGRAHITGLPADRYKFKVPSLRNVEVTRPYMHDGRFLTLDQVLSHYTNGIQSSPTLDPQLVGGIALTAAEKTALIAFLKTLTDQAYLQDRRFAEPTP